jgi:ShK domain-like
MDDRAAIARTLKKPIILEEYAMRAQGYLPTRVPLFNFFHKTANDAGYACTLVWAVSHYSTDADTKGTLFGYNDGQGYVFSYDGDGSQPVLAQYQYQRVCTDIPKTTRYTCAQEKSRGQCGTTHLNGYCKRTCNKCSTVCQDIAPSTAACSTCAELKQQNVCSSSWMSGYCQQTCGKCPAYCKDIPPTTTYSCAQEKQLGTCGTTYMRGYCKLTCGPCP